MKVKQRHREERESRVTILNELKEKSVIFTPEKITQFCPFFLKKRKGIGLLGWAFSNQSRSRARALAQASWGV